MTTTDILAVPGVPESRLDEATLAQLPSEAPPAPWVCDCDAVVWMHRPSRAASEAIDPAVASTGRVFGVIGAMVRYRSTPVGTYNEVFGAVGLRDGRSVFGSVPFMAVDSLVSLVGGRTNWSLPKSIATFSGSPSGSEAMAAEAAGWTIRATPRVLGPALPARLSGRLAQCWPDGQIRDAVLRSRGRMRPALVRVDVRSDGPLATWLRSGWHLGAVISDATFTLPKP